MIWIYDKNSIQNFKNIKSLKPIQDYQMPKWASKYFGINGLDKWNLEENYRN